MSENDTKSMARRPLVVAIPSEVETRRDLSFTGAGRASQTFDLYLPAESSRRLMPVGVIVSGYNDSGFQSFVGARFKDMTWTTSWAQLLASSGIAVVTYTNTDPAADLKAVLNAIREGGDDWSVDAARIGLFATSGHVPTALSALMAGFDPEVKCAALAYGYTLDLDASTAVADAAAAYRFANPCRGRSVSDLREGVHLLLVRAGRDEMPGLNNALDAFIAASLERNVELTLVNHAAAPHAFDLVHDSDATRSAIAMVVRFLADELRR